MVVVAGPGPRPSMIAVGLMGLFFSPGELPPPVAATAARARASAGTNRMGRSLFRFRAHPKRGDNPRNHREIPCRFGAPRLQPRGNQLAKSVTSGGRGLRSGARPD